MWRSRKGSPSEIEGKNSLMVMLPGIEGMTQQLLIFLRICYPCFEHN